LKKYFFLLMLNLFSIRNLSNFYTDGISLTYRKGFKSVGLTAYLNAILVRSHVH
jgi:hypothetical protein